MAGDHLKSASDNGVPLVGVGLLYQYSYFQQYLNADGWQLETYLVNCLSRSISRLIVRPERPLPLLVAVFVPVMAPSGTFRWAPKVLDLLRIRAIVRWAELIN